MANFSMRLTTITPLHIGNGNELSNKFDFVIGKKEGKIVTGRLNIDKILQDKYDKRFPDKLPADLIIGDMGNSAYYRYIIPGEPQSKVDDSRIFECIKNSNDVPFIPGSSIKGTIRTIYGSMFLSDKKEKYLPAKEVPFFEKDKNGNINKIDRKKLDNKINSAIFHEKVKDDPFRSIIVSDALLPEKWKPDDTMRIINTNSYSQKKSKAGVTISLECAKNNLNFFGSLKIDGYTIEKNRFTDVYRFSENIIKYIRYFSECRLEKLISWYKKIDNSEIIIKNLTTLLQMNSEQSDSSALIQIGHGTGWDGMTYSKWLNDSDNDIFFENLYDKYLRKPTKGKTPSREPGDDFPSSRTVILQSDKPAIPLGWVLLTLEPK